MDWSLVVKGFECFIISTSGALALQELSVRKYATNAAAFFEDFAKGMLKMSNIKPLTGSQGQIRINCGKVN